MSKSIQMFDLIALAPPFALEEEKQIKTATKSLPNVNVTKSLPNVNVTKSLPNVNVTKNLPLVDLTKGLI